MGICAGNGRMVQKSTLHYLIRGRTAGTIMIGDIYEMGHKSVEIGRPSGHVHMTVTVGNAKRAKCRSVSRDLATKYRFRWAASVEHPRGDAHHYTKPCKGVKHS
jgi:hypothetical protein